MKHQLLLKQIQQKVNIVNSSVENIYITFNFSKCLKYFMKKKKQAQFAVMVFGHNIYQVCDTGSGIQQVFINESYFILVFTMLQRRAVEWKI